MELTAKGYTCLHFAVYFGNYDVFLLLKTVLEKRGKDEFEKSLFIKNGTCDPKDPNDRKRLSETVFESFQSGVENWKSLKERYAMMKRNWSSEKPQMNTTQITETPGTRRMLTGSMLQLAQP